MQANIFDFSVIVFKNNNSTMYHYNRNKYDEVSFSINAMRFLLRLLMLKDNTFTNMHREDIEKQES